MHIVQHNILQSSMPSSLLFHLRVCGSAASCVCEADSELQIQDYSLGKCSDNVFFLIENVLLDGRPRCELFFFPSAQYADVFACLLR